MLRKRTGHIGMSEADRLARMNSLGGSDARIIMSGNQDEIERLWKEKRGEIEPKNFDDVLLIQLGNVSEPINADFFENAMGLVVTDEQKKAHYPAWPTAHSTLDGLVRKTEADDPIAIVEFKFMLPFYFDDQKAVDKYYAQLQHNMMVTGMPLAYLSIICVPNHVIIPVEADPLYQMDLFEALKDFWDCVQTGRTPGVPEIKVPLIERVKVVDMTGNNEWAAFSNDYLRTKEAAEVHEKSKKSLKNMVPKDAKSVSGHGVAITLSANGKQMIKADEDALREASALGFIPSAEPKPKRASRKKVNVTLSDLVAGITSENRHSEIEI